MVTEDTLKNNSLDGIELLEYVIEKQRQAITDRTHSIGALKDHYILEVEKEYRESHPTDLSNADKRRYEVTRRLEEDPVYTTMKGSIDTIRVQITYDDIHLRALKRAFVIKYGPFPMAI